MALSDRSVPADPEFLLSTRSAERRHRVLALLVVVGLVGGLLLVAPFAGTPLAGTEALLPAYAASVLLLDLVAATLLLAQFLVHGGPALLALAVGYLVSGLAAVPWALAFPEVFTATGLLGSGLQTAAVIAALRRLALPAALLTYAVLQRGQRPVVVDPAATRPAALLAVLGSVALVVATTWLAVAGGPLTPGFMVDARVSTGVWTVVLDASLLMTAAAAALLLARRRGSLLDLWLLVTLVATACEIVLLGFLGAGLRFSVGWWAGRGFGLLSAGVLTLALLAETAGLHARLLTSLLAEQRVREARATLLESLAAALAHELNQPLTSIVTSADAGLRWLDRPEPDLVQARARLRRIAADGHSAGAIIASLRRAFGKRPNRRELVDIPALIHEVVGQARAEARQMGASIDVGIQAGLPLVLGDAVPLRQALHNLLTNALDAVAATSNGPRTIHVACSGRGSEIAMAVADTGTGLGDGAHLFDAFYTTKPQGMGLGLMICRTVIEAHGGRVAARANAPRGAVFEVTLPAAASGADHG